MQNEANTEMALKNGSQIDPALGLALFGMLENMLQRKPIEFRALLALAQGRTDGISENDLVILREGLLVRNDGSINAHVRDVLLSGYQQDPGPMMINPFRLDSKDQAEELEKKDDENWRRLARLIREEGENKGRRR